MKKHKAGRLSGIISAQLHSFVLLWEKKDISGACVCVSVGGVQSEVNEADGKPELRYCRRK